jgi:acetyl coenzyme A synthetase (ADP forming)-like protein
VQVKINNIEKIMKPGSVAVIGASDKPGKVGTAIMQNYIDVGFQGKLYPVNISGQPSIMGHKAYKSILDVREPIDLAVICVPADATPKVLNEAGRAKVKGTVIVTSGFSEVGRNDLQAEIIRISEAYKMPVIGPNCLGVMDTRSRNDTLFLPTAKIDRPKIGGVSFVSQSGSVGSSILDLISGEGFGLSKFISYGNAAVVDEVDILDYLSKDKDTNVVVLYMEGARRAKELMSIAKKITKAKPIVVLKGGRTESGSKAAHSHTASLAGSNNAYHAFFNQFGFIEAEGLEELLWYGKIFDTQPLCRGNRVGVITNGGGHGVLAADALYQNGLILPELDGKMARDLRKKMPPIVNIRLPLDIGGDAGADRFSSALSALSSDPNIDVIMVITLFQTPGADESVASAIVDVASRKEKPIVVVSTGSTYTRSHTAIIEASGVPVYESPDAAAKSISALVKYSRYKGVIK